MRTFLVIFLVLVCMALSIRVDGVWPPKSVHERIEFVVEQVSEPGKALLALLGDRLSPNPERERIRPVRSTAVLKAMVDGDGVTGRPGTACS
jgi:hypothetical protein